MASRTSVSNGYPASGAFLDVLEDLQQMEDAWDRLRRVLVMGLNATQG